MKPETLKIFGQTIFAFFLLVAIPMITSCERLKEDPLYAGTWQNKDKLYVGDLTYNTTTTLKLTEDTFEQVYSLQRDNSSDITSLPGLKGSLECSFGF